MATPTDPSNVAATGLEHYLWASGQLPPPWGQMKPQSAAIGLRDELKVNICHELLVPRQFTELKATNNSSVEPSRKAVSNLIAGTQLLQHGHHAFKAELGSVAPPSSASSAWPPSAGPASFCHFADLTQRCMKSRLDSAFCEQRARQPSRSSWKEAASDPRLRASFVF